MLGYENIQKAMGVDIPVSTRMGTAILLWSNMYTNQAPWIKDGIHGIGLPAAIASEHARLVTMESKFSFPNTGRGQYIADQFSSVRTMLPTYTEFGVAKGGFVLKPYVDGGNILTDFVHADDFFPVAFGGAGKVTACIFPEYKKQGKKLYTRLEYHELKGDQYRIANRAFCSENASVTVNNIINIGDEISLDRVEEWKGLAPEVVISGVNYPLFAYFRVPVANNIDPHSPLGISIYSRASDLIRDADEQYGAAVWEFRSKETAVQAGREYFKKDRYGNELFPEGKERLFQMFNDIDGKTGLFNVFSPDIRDQSFYNGLNRMLQRIEFNSGLAYGTLSDPQNVDKTAEEIKSSKQRSYATVTSIQNAMEDTLKDLVRAMCFWADHEGLAPAGECEITCDWDDSVTVDSETKRKRDLEEVAAGIMAPWEYRMRHYKEDEETAKSRIPDQAEVIP